MLGLEMSLLLVIAIVYCTILTVDGFRSSFNTNVRSKQSTSGQLNFSNNKLDRSSSSRRIEQSTALPMSLALKILEGVVEKFDSKDVYRVAQCWDKFTRGQVVQRYVEGNKEALQVADCFVEGLSTKPFHDIADYPWAVELSKQYKEILEELDAYEKKIGSPIEQQWQAARDTEGASYGPEWKTLALQDRGNWDDDRAPHFPRTVKLMQQLQVPSMEAFFARQGPGSGIKPHTDKNNFIITCHVGLDVPEGQCWIQVGDQKYYWKNGESCVFDTSITHSTFNEAEVPRRVLLIRFWHPDLTPVEREAFEFIFNYLDHASHGEDALQHFEMQHKLLGKDQHKGLQVTNSATSADTVALEKELRDRNNKKDKANKKNRGKPNGAAATGGKKGFG